MDIKNVLTAIISAIISALIVVGSLPKKDDAGNDAKISQIEQSITKLETEDFFTKIRIDNLKNGAAFFSPSSQGYVPLSTPAGNLLVSLRHVEKYANGYKLYFDIGNPTLASFAGTKISVSWNRAIGKDEDYSNWEKNTRMTQITLNDKLMPGRWNKTVVTISPAKEDETGYIKVMLDSDQVSLLQ